MERARATPLAKGGACEVLREAAIAYTDFSLKYHRVVVNLCEMGFAPANVTRAFASRGFTRLVEQQSA